MANNNSNNENKNVVTNPAMTNEQMEQFVKERTWVSKDSEVRDYIIIHSELSY